MEKKNYNLKKTISMKRFIKEFGENFTSHVKQRLMELEVRCVLTRKEDTYRLDLKHVEHTMYNYEFGSHDISDTSKKEFVYGQFVIIDGELYFSERCTDNDKVIESPIVSTIYNNLSGENMKSDSDINAKKVDDDNIDYIIDSILTVCPEVSKSYMDIMSKYL